MTNSTGTNFEEWHAHVTQLEAHAGKPVVAQMITDNAPYFESHKMIAFNRKKGIVHVSSPSYTQELNGLAERTIGTVLAMTRTNLDHSNGPERSYGECIMAMCEVLDVLQHKAGGKLTRLEKWHGKLMPRQHERIRTWGCAAYLHLDYGPRGKIDNVSKLEPRAKLTMMVGYDKSGMGWRVAELPGFQIRTAVHLTFVEDQFPCRTSINRELPAFDFSITDVETDAFDPGSMQRALNAVPGPRQNENLRLSARCSGEYCCGNSFPPR